MSTPMTTSAATATLGSSSSRISTSLNPRLRRRSHIPHTVFLSFGCLRFPNRSLCLLPTATGQGPQDPALLRRPLVSDPSSSEGPIDSFISSEEEEEGEESDTESSGPGQGMRRRSRKSEEWVDWEDLILEETVPLASFIRMILHSGKYKSGDRLSSEHEKIILERLLPYHPEMEKKIGCGFDHITIGFHPEYENSRCLFIVQKDGESVDFSYWKCIKGLIRRKYPLYADTFILRHFKRRRYLYPLCLVHFTLGKLEQKYACIAQVFESTWAVGRQGPFRLEKVEQVRGAIE